MKSEWKKYGDGGLTIDVPKESSSKTQGNMSITAKISFGNLSALLENDKEDKFKKMNDILLENESIWTNDWSFETNEQTDKDGWSYSTSWKEKNFSSESKKAKVRTKKWVRSQRKFNHVLLKQIGLDPILLYSPKYEISEPFDFKK